MNPARVRCRPEDAAPAAGIGTTRHPRFEIRNHMAGAFAGDLAGDVLDGMTAEQKYIPSKYFYDGRGSRLFEAICTLPEYYLTRTELSVLRDRSRAIMEPFGAGDLVEMGSGANWKISTLIDAAERPHGDGLRYVPVDVSEPALVAASEGLVRKYRMLTVLGIVGDFTRDLHRVPDGVPKIVMLFGSTVGNFDEAACHRLLRSVADVMRPGDRFLIGIDMIKPVPVLEAAYNDSRGITGEFNRNVLHVINRELHADFDPALFDHVAFYDAEKEQVEMHLRARQKTTVVIRDLDLSVEFERGETIRTEISRKFSRESAEALFSRAGLSADRWFSDPKGWFSLVELASDRR